MTVANLGTKWFVLRAGDGSIVRRYYHRGAAIGGMRELGLGACVERPDGGVIESYDGPPIPPPVREPRFSWLEPKRNYMRRTAPGPRVISGRALKRQTFIAEAASDPDDLDLEPLPERPKTRGECPEERPCPFVSCRYNLYLDVNPDTGAIKLNFPHLEPWEIPQTCALDVADQGGATLDEVAQALNLVREGARLIEARALPKLREAVEGGEE